MKKNLVRIVAALLVAMLALTLIPMGAFAATVDVNIESYAAKVPTVDDYWNNWDYLGFNTHTGLPSVTVKTSDYENLYEFDGDLYELKGFIDFENTNWNKDDAKLKYTSTVTAKGDAHLHVTLGYALHTHDLSCWYSDGTTHWRECLECGENFMYQNWCTDGDEDGICNVCGGDVPYHDVTVIEEEGGKITVNRDNACHRMKITADVEPAEGYKLEKLHFTKIRDDGSEQEITRYKKNGQFWTYMPTYELEVTAEFVKK